MQLFSALLFGISASLDALIIGLTYGMRGNQITLRQNFLISLITLWGTCLSVALGALSAALLPISHTAMLGSGLLILMGCYYLIKFMSTSLKKYLNLKKSVITQAQQASEETAATMSITEIILLGITLSVNNMGIGLSASIAGLSLTPAAIVTFLCSVLFLLAGNRLGRCGLLPRAEHYADIISGLLLVLLGICG